MWTYGVSRLTANPQELPLVIGGTQTLSLDAGPTHASRTYWMFGSLSGTAPGISLLGVPMPLNPDAYTDLVIGATNRPVFMNFRGTLDARGKATATLNVPANQPIPLGVRLDHAYLVLDAQMRPVMASNPEPLVFR